MSNSPAQYSPVRQGNSHDESTEKLLEDSTEPMSQSQLVERRPAWRRLWLWVAAGIFVCSSILALLVTVRSIRHQCGAQLSTFTPCTAPAFEAVDYHSVLFNGTLRHSSIYRGSPNAELDAAWDRITMQPRPIQVSKETLLKTGKDVRSSTVRFREEDGGGYMATLEFTHQLHCLNSLRKISYREYYEPTDVFFKAHQETIRTHIDHCIEILRQNLMCTADVGLVTYEWVEGFSEPYPDFSTWHKCRNFDKVLDWNYAHGVHIPKSHVSRFPDTIDLVNEP